MAIRDNQTGTVHEHCAACEAPLDLSVARVQDNESGRMFCDALCHHTAYYGIRPPVTVAEEMALARAQEWMRTHR